MLCFLSLATSYPIWKSCCVEKAERSQSEIIKQNHLQRTDQIARNDAHASHTRFHWSRVVCDCKITPSLSRLLQLHAKEWPHNTDYIATKILIEELLCTNDVAGRALSLVTTIHSSSSVPKFYLLFTIKNAYCQKLQWHAQDADSTSCSWTVLRNISLWLCCLSICYRLTG